MGMRSILGFLLFLTATAFAQNTLISRVQLVPLSNYVDAVNTSLINLSNRVIVTSNSLVTVIASGNTTTSNGLMTIIVANDSFTSNGVVSFTMTASNTLRTDLLAADITTSNGLRATVTNSLTVSNLFARVGSTTSNASVGGQYFFDLNPYTNFSPTITTFTNLAVIPVPGNTLTNNGDAVRLFWSGKLINAIASTNNFQIVTGALTPLDTGIQILSNGSFSCEVTLTRRGNSSILFNGAFTFIADCQGIGTNIVHSRRSILVLDCGTNNSFALRGSARRNFVQTNDFARAEYLPASR